MDDCIFCKISKRELSAKLVYEDADLFAFEDIAPKAGLAFVRSERITNRSRTRHRHHPGKAGGCCRSVT